MGGIGQLIPTHTISAGRQLSGHLTGSSQGEISVGAGLRAVDAAGAGYAGG
jgi:hypothetical protein